MKSKWFYIGLAGVLLISLMTGCGKTAETSSSKADGEAAGTMEDVKPLAVEVEAIKEGSLSNTDRIIGEVAANTSISVLSKVPGTIVELSVKKGDTVKNGQVIGKLDQTDYLLRVKQAEAALGSAQAGLKQAESGNGVNVAGSSYELAKSSMELAQTSYERAIDFSKRGLEIAESEYQRNKSLAESNVVSKKEFEDAEARYLSAKSQYKAQVEQAESVLIQAKSQLNQAAKSDAQSTASIEVARARVKEAQVGVEMAKSTLKDTLVKATADGIITDIMIEVGDAISPQMPMASLINFNPALIKLNITENNLSKFKIGNELEVHVPSQSKKLTGKVSYVGLEASSQSKMFPVELEVNNENLSILPGMKVDVMVKDMEGKKGQLVPTSAIIEVDGKKVVYVVEADTSVIREVVLSEGNTSYVIAESGVQAGDQVVVKGHTQLKDQSKVRIVQK